MREILFRGKRKNWKELPEDKWWVEGYFIILPDGKHAILSNSGYAWVDPETVCQYTGETDKNGKKIFEGDIIRDIDYGLMRCIYLHGSFVWLNDDKFRWIELQKHITKEEVIGNIFDNPDLMDCKKGADA